MLTRKPPTNLSSYAYPFPPIGLRVGLLALPMSLAVACAASSDDAGSTASAFESSTTCDLDAGTSDASPSADCSSLTSATGEIVDGAGNRWTLGTGGDGSLVVLKNGAPAGYSDHVTQLVYVDGVVSQENAAHGWWSWNGTGWASENDPTSACRDGGSVGGGHVTVPAGLPPYFAFGVQSQAEGTSWMTGTGVPWNYRYTYVNLGWEQWNSPAGAFATLYMNQSEANHYTTVFTFYLLGQPGAGTTQSPSFMNRYYASWELLLKQVGAFGKPVVIHLEPDTWSFFQQWYGNDPHAIPVSVASSGFAEVAAFANTAAGFAQALVALRDKYARNAVLAIDNSSWAVNWNPISPTVSAATAGASVAAFYQGLGAKFDMFFFNTADRDSAYCQLVAKAVGSGPGSTAQCWWGSSPDGSVHNDAFTNFQQYIATIHGVTGIPSMLWQTPSGNTMYDTCNNSNHHFQDNRPQYFLQDGNRKNISSYANAGVIGVLFGTGQAQPYTPVPYSDTAYFDEAHDGTTNPAPIDGNALVAKYSDDDGGFLRLSAAAYYAAGPEQIP